MVIAKEEYIILNITVVLSMVVVVFSVHTVVYGLIIVPVAQPVSPPPSTPTAAMQSSAQNPMFLIPETLPMVPLLLSFIVTGQAQAGGQQIFLRAHQPIIVHPQRLEIHQDQIHFVQ